MIIIALGANLPGRFGSPREELAAALEMLAGLGIKIIRTSRLYLTQPVPVSDQPWYHNAVAVVETGLSAFALLEVLQSIEQKFGRVRAERNAPRVLDLDLIAYDNVILDKPELIVPHPRAHQRAFVMLPLMDVAPDWVHPLSGQGVRDIVASLPKDQIIKIEGAFP